MAEKNAKWQKKMAEKWQKKILCSALFLSVHKSNSSQCSPAPYCSQLFLVKCKDPVDLSLDFS